MKQTTRRRGLFTTQKFPSDSSRKKNPIRSQLIPEYDEKEEEEKLPRRLVRSPTDGSNKKSYGCVNDHNFNPEKTQSNSKVILMNFFRSLIL